MVTETIEWNRRVDLRAQILQVQTNPTERGDDNGRLWIVKAGFDFWHTAHLGASIVFQNRYSYIIFSYVNHTMSKL